MSLYYLLRVNGDIVECHNNYKLLSDFKISDLGYDIEDNLYIFTVADEVNILMHPYNEKFDYELPVNLALQKFFPDSKYMGDIVIAKTDPDGYEFLEKNWDLQKSLSGFKAQSLGSSRHLFVESSEKSSYETKLDLDHDFEFYSLD